MKRLPQWEEFELAISEILGDNDFDFFYQFEIPLSKPDFDGRRKRIIDYVAAFKGLFLLVDSKAWKEMITPPALQFASGRVGYTIEAINKLFWDACIFETGLLDFWEPKCPYCDSNKIKGYVVYIKVPESVPPEGFYAFVDRDGDPMIYTHFTCEICSEIAETKGYTEPKLKKSQIFPTNIPMIVSKVPFKTIRGIKKHFHYLAPYRGFCAVMGDVMDSCVIPKPIFMNQIDALDTFLKELVESGKYPDVVTPSLEKLQDRFKRKPIDPNRILINYLRPKRKEHYWLSPGAEAADRVTKLSRDMVEEAF